MRCQAIIVCAITLGSWAPALFAQSATKPDVVTIPNLQKRIKFVQGNNELSPPVKEKVVNYLEGALERLEIAEEQTERATKLERKLEGAPETLGATQKRLADLPAAPNSSIVSIKDTDELSRVVSAREREIDDSQTGLRKQIADLDAEQSQWRTRPEELVNELAEIDDRLHDISDEQEGLGVSTDPRELIQAHLLFLESRRKRAETERRMIQAESAWFQSPQAAELLQAQQELAAKTLSLKVAELGLLETELNKRRGDEADQRVHRAETVLAQVSPAIKIIAEENLQLAKEHREVTHKIHDVETRHESTTATFADLQKEFSRTQEMVSDVGLTDTIGLLLRQQRSKLIDERTLRANLSRRNDLVRETRMRLFQINTERESLIDLDAAAAKRAAELDPVSEQKSVPEGLRDLLNEQRLLFKGIEVEYTRYFKQLFEMDVLERRTLELSSKYADYVDERVLWIRTGPMFGQNHIAKLNQSITWLSDRALWRAVAEAGSRDVKRHPLPWATAGILFVMWLVLFPVGKWIIHRKGVVAAQPDCRELSPTLQTLIYSVILASGRPLLVAFIGWRLDHTSSTVSFVHAVAVGLMRAAMFAFPLELLRIACLRGGLAAQHFDWPVASINRWRRNTTWFLPIGVALIATIGLIEGTADEHRLDVSGRATFLIFAMFSALFCLLAFRRDKTPKATPGSTSLVEGDLWSERFWRFAPFAAFVLCTGLFLLAWAGFFYTALQLTWRAQRTAILGVGLLMLRSVLRRWIALERRRMAVLQDKELQSITEAGREPGNAGHNTFLFPRWNWPDFRLNLTQIVTQMRSLLDTGMITLGVIGLWLIWADVTPALNILDRFTLWQTTVEQTVTADDVEHGPSAKTIMRPKRVTAADLGLAILVIAIAVIAGRNIPGLVEVILHEHLSVDAGIRFAVTCLVRYAIFVAGVCAAFAQISIGWANVQWLVAAASVGLGFGLQEIFCNFVSGIILLFERPMRVGDVVTIGDTTGTVSRIRFRATTIVDGDRKELIVPNREFITGHLLNWTLSDRVNRVGVKIAVAGNNDPQRVRRLLLEIANQQPLLLKDPPPSATLEDVNGGLTFMVRGFLPTLDSRATAIHELYSAINNRFRAECIAFSCPSHEVFVRMDPSAAPSGPPAPHQSASPASGKSLPLDFGGAFRRA